MKKLKYFLIIFILLFSYNTYCDDYNVTNTITAPNCNGTQCNGGKYRGLEIYNTGIESIYDVSTRYNGTLSSIIFRVPVPSSFADGPDCFSTGDISYTLILNMATDDWRNHFAYPFISSGASGTNWATSSVVYVSYRKIYFTFQIPNSNTCIDSLYVKLNSTNISTTAFTGRTNWNLSNVTLTANFPTSSGGSSGGGSSGSGSTTIITDNTDVINNANQNTQDIINNQNKNTESTNKLLGDCYKNLFNYQAYQNTNQNLIIDSSINGFKIPANIYSVGSEVYFRDFCPECQNGKTYYLGATSSSTNSKYVYISGTIWSFNTSLTITPSILNSRVNFYGIYPGGTGSSSDYVTISNIYVVEGSSPKQYSKYNEQICSSKIDDMNTNITNSTDTIINNANQNTQQQIESQQVCNLYDKASIVTNNKYLNANGFEISDNRYGISDYINIYNADINKLTTYGVVISTCYYDINKTIVSCTSNNNISVGVVNAPTNSYYMRFSIDKNENKPSYKICKNGNQALNDVLTDDSNPNISDNEFTNLFNTVGFNDPLSYLLQLPIQFINQLVSQSNVCQTISLGTLWGVSISLPCINIGSIIGQQVWDIIDILFSVGLLVVIFKNLYQTFANLMTLGGEKEAREKFSMPTPMEFLSIILGGDK